jgi:hypothetical protein
MGPFPQLTDAPVVYLVRNILLYERLWKTDLL